MNKQHDPTLSTHPLYVARQAALLGGASGTSTFPAPRVNTGPCSFSCYTSVCCILCSCTHGLIPSVDNWWSGGASNPLLSSSPYHVYATLHSMFALPFDVVQSTAYEPISSTASGRAHAKHRMNTNVLTFSLVPFHSSLPTLCIRYDTQPCVHHLSYQAI